MHHRRSHCLFQMARKTAPRFLNLRWPVCNNLVGCKCLWYEVQVPDVKREGRSCPICCPNEVFLWAVGGQGVRTEGAQRIAAINRLDQFYACICAPIAHFFHTAADDGDCLRQSDLHTVDDKRQIPQVDHCFVSFLTKSSTSTRSQANAIIVQRGKPLF